MTSAPRRVRVPRAVVDQQVRHMTAVAEGLRGLDLEDLSIDPLAVLSAWPAVELRTVPDTEITGECSVAGTYLAGDPAILAVARSTSMGRRAFTALHELGHHLQQTQLPLARALAEHDTAYGEALEDLACDGFAGTVLLPEALVDEHIGAAGPTAGGVARLEEATTASRAAVCVRAAQRLPSPGHVLLLDGDGEVQFAAASGLPPVRRGSKQGNMPVIARALAGGGLATGRGRFTYRDGIEGQELFAQVGPLRGYLVALAVTDHPAWEERFTLPIADAPTRAPGYECANPACGETYQSYDARCNRCGVSPCSSCGRCACESQAAERLCEGCFLMHPATSFVGDRCGDCS